MDPQIGSHAGLRVFFMLLCSLGGRWALPDLALNEYVTAHDTGLEVGTTLPELPKGQISQKSRVDANLMSCCQRYSDSGTTAREKTNEDQ